MNYDLIIKESGKTKEWALLFQFESYSEALEAVKEDGEALRYVKEQTEEICLEAVRQDGEALRYVHF